MSVTHRRRGTFCTWLLFTLALLCVPSAYATTTTATVTDASAHAYGNGTVRAQFIPANGGPALADVTGTLNSSGAFSITLTDNTTVSPAGSQWRFIICAWSGAPCFTTPGIVISGASQSVTTFVHASTPLLQGNAQISTIIGLADTPIEASGAGGQTAPLLLITNSIGTTLLSLSASGTLTCTVGCGAGGGIGGANTQVQYNDSGAFNGAVGLTYVKATADTTIANTLGNAFKTNDITHSGDPTVTNADGTVVDVQAGSIELFGTGGATPLAIFQANLATIVGTIKASDSVQLTGLTSGSATLGVASIAFTPARINLPTTTGTVGQCLTTDGGTPQQTSWAACAAGNVTSVTGTTNQITSSGGATPVLSIPNLFVPPSQLELGSSTIISTAPLEIHVGATEFAAAFYSHSGTSFFTPEFDFYRSRGTQASPTALVTSDQLQYQIWNGYDGTAYATGGLMLLQTLENWDATHHGAFIQFNTVIAGTASNVDMFDIGIGTGGHNVSRANLVALAGKCIGISSSAASTASDSTCIWRDGSDGIFAFGSATPNDKSGTLEAATVTATGVITANTTFVGPLVQSAVDSVASAPLAAITVRGGDITGGTGSLSAGGNVTLRSGNNAASNATSAAGNIDILPGLSTGATQGLQGLLLFSENYIKGGGTSTKWNLQCIVTTTAMTVNDCGASPTTSIIGIAFAVNSNTVQVNTIGSQTPVNASAAVTVGDTVCAGSTAGQVTDSGGTSPCGTGAGFTVGTVLAVSGTYVLPIAGSTTLSTTLPLIQLTRAQGIGVANNVAWSGVTSGANAQTGAFSTTAPWTFSVAGAASTPGIFVTGTPFAGTGTTSFPQVYINDGTSAAPTNWATPGTMLGGNIPSGFTGDVMDWKSANSTIMRLTAGGALSLNIGGASFLVNGNVSTSGAGVLSGTYAAASGHIFYSNTTPSVSSGFGTGASVTASNGTAAFRVNVGTSNTGNGIVLLPAASTGWNCFATDLTTKSAAVSHTLQVGVTSTTLVTLQNYTDLAVTGAWADSDVLSVSCFAF